MEMDLEDTNGRQRLGSDVTEGQLHHTNALVDSFAENIFRCQHLDRALERRHLTGIGFAGTIGIGAFTSSGELISLSGSAGCVIGFLGSGAIVIGVMRSLAEMVSVRPYSGAMLDFPHTFVDPALGFTVGVMYWLSQCIAMACLTSGAVRVADTLSGSGMPIASGGKASVTVALLFITLISNVCGVRLYGRLERFVKWFKMTLIVLLCILMIIVNLGVGGPRTGSGSGNYTINAMPSSFRPSGFNNTEALFGEESSLSTFEISGPSGQFLAVWTSITLGVFACMGGDMVIVAAGEAKNPRKDVAPATRFLYLAPIFSYLLLSFLVGFNINYGDPDLFHPFSKYNSNASHSPFIIVLKSTRFNALPAVINVCFLISAYTAANTALYISSRTLFALCQRYGTQFLKNTFGKTNSGHTPIAAILLSSLFGLLAFLGLADASFNQPLLSLSAFFVSGIACVYSSECIAFIRFKKGLDRLQKNNILSRDDSTYTDMYYRAHWQPLCAYFGLLGCVAIVLFSGWPAIYILASRGRVIGEDDLKSSVLLAADLIGAYSAPALFLIIYFSYKLIFRTRIVPLRKLDEEIYQPPDFNWDLSRSERPTSWKGWAYEIFSFIE